MIQLENWIDLPFEIIQLVSVDLGYIFSFKFRPVLDLFKKIWPPNNANVHFTNNTELNDF